MATEVSVELAEHEALVLFEFLSREVDDKDGVHLKPSMTHEAELWALNTLLNLLERKLATPFASDYADQLDSARTALVDQNGSWPD